VILALDSPGKTLSSFSITLSGVLPATYTHEHMVLAAIPVIIGGKVITTKMIAMMRIARIISDAIQKIFFMINWVLPRSREKYNK
jgi:hypothetical protein